MNKEKMPTFWNKFTYFSSIIFSLATSCVSSVYLPQCSNLMKVLIIIGIFIISYIISLLLCSIIYAIILYSYTKKLQKQYYGLENSNNVINTQYNNLLKDYSYAKKIVKATINALNFGILNANEYEVNFLKHLLDTIYEMNKDFIEDEGDKNDKK